MRSNQHLAKIGEKEYSLNGMGNLFKWGLILRKLRSYISVTVNTLPYPLAELK